MNKTTKEKLEDLGKLLLQELEKASLHELCDEDKVFVLKFIEKRLPTRIYNLKSKIAREEREKSRINKQVYYKCSQCKKTEIKDINFEDEAANIVTESRCYRCKGKSFLLKEIQFYKNANNEIKM